MSDADVTDGERAHLIASAASLFIPALICYARQPIFYWGLMLPAAVASTLYHITNEDTWTYGQVDVIWSGLVMLLFGLHVWLVSYEYGFLRLSAETFFRVQLPLMFAGAGLFFYTYHGSITDTRPRQYELHHSLWHWFTTAASALQFWTQSKNYMLLFTTSAWQVTRVIVFGQNRRSSVPRDMQSLLYAVLSVSNKGKPTTSTQFNAALTDLELALSSSSSSTFEGGGGDDDDDTDTLSLLQRMQLRNNSRRNAAVDNDTTHFAFGGGAYD